MDFRFCREPLMAKLSVWTCNHNVYPFVFTLFFFTVKLGQIHILNVSIDGNLQDEEITHVAYF